MAVKEHVIHKTGKRRRNKTSERQNSVARNNANTYCCRVRPRAALRAQMPCVESTPGCKRKREGRSTSMAMQTMPFIQRSFLLRFTPLPNLLSLSLPCHFTPHMVLTRSQGEWGKGGWMIIQLHHTLPPAWPTHTHTLLLKLQGHAPDTAKKEKSRLLLTPHPCKLLHLRGDTHTRNIKQVHVGPNLASWNPRACLLSPPLLLSLSLSLHPLQSVSGCFCLADSHLPCHPHWPLPHSDRPIIGLGFECRPISMNLHGIDKHH